MVRRLFTLLFIASLSAFIAGRLCAAECVIGKGPIPNGIDGFKRALNEAQNGRCFSDSARFRNRYNEFFPGATEFQVIMWDQSSELSLGEALPEITGYGETPLVIIADANVTVKLTGNGVQSALILKGNRIIIDHLTIEGFSGTGVVMEGERDVVIRSRIISNGENGILITGKDNRVFDSEIANNGINGVFIGGLGSGKSCGNDMQFQYGRGTVVASCDIHDNGQGVSGATCADLSNPDGIGPCLSLKLEAQRCFDLLQEDPSCDEPSVSLDDPCGYYWHSRKRCLDLWSKAAVSDGMSKEDVITTVFNAYAGAQGGSGIVADALNVKILSWKPSGDEVDGGALFTGRIYNNRSKGIYVNTLPSSALCQDNSSPFDLTKLQTTLVSEIFVGDLFVSRFALPVITQIAASQGAKEITVSGTVNISKEAWYPWNIRTINVSALKAEIFVKDGDGGVFAGRGPVDSSGRFTVHIAYPVTVNGRAVEEPVFIAALVDAENGNTSPSTGSSFANPSGDDDNDGLPNDEEDLNHNGQVDSGETDPINPDTDGDGLTDGEEKFHTGRVEALINQNYPFAEIDRLNPLKADSDGDCLPDGLELGVSESDAKQLLDRMPSRPHLVISVQCQAIMKAGSVTALENAIRFDETALASWDNIAMLFDADPETITDPSSSDTDRDGMKDGNEDFNFNGRRDKNEQNGGTEGWLETDPVLADSDDDGIIDGDEGDKDNDGKLGPNESDPHLDDTDGDGVKDGKEVRIGTYPNACDSDDDGLSDGVEVGAIKPATPGSSCHGLEAAGTNYRNPYAMDPLNPDSDGDGLLDGVEDANGNGWIEAQESDPSIPDSDGDGLSDGTEALGDFDGDKIPDFDLNLITAGPKCSPPSDIGDVDCDGIPNATDVDSDDDGCPDAEEGGWRDQNANGIPDVYDNESKSCGGGTGGSFSIGGGGSTGEGGQQSESPPEGGRKLKTPAWLLDKTGGGVCSLIINPENDSFNLSFTALIFIFYLSVIAYLLRCRFKHAVSKK